MVTNRKRTSTCVADKTVPSASTTHMPASDASERWYATTVIPAPPKPRVSGSKLPAQQRGFAALRIVENSGSNCPKSPKRKVIWLHTGQSVTIGNSEVEAEWQLEGDSRIASEHFRLSFDGSRFDLESLDAARGTWVNGENIHRVKLVDGDIVKAGRTVFRVQLGRTGQFDGLT